MSDDEILKDLKHVDSSYSGYDVILDFADTKVSIRSMKITPTYGSFGEGALSAINACIFEREQEKFRTEVAKICAKSFNGLGYYFVMPVLYDLSTPYPEWGPRSMFGKWRFEINIENWVKSTPEKEFEDQLYTLTVVLLSNKIADDQVTLSQHLSQYTKDLEFFKLAHKCTDDEMSF